MPFYRLYYHIVWATKDRRPLLVPEIESIVHSMLREKARKLDPTVYTVGGVADHVHLVATIPPKLAVATFVGQVKGATATQFNKLNHYAGSVYWQREYGAFTFDQKRLHQVVDYVLRQKEHHANGNLIPVLERYEDEA